MKYQWEEGDISMGRVVKANNGNGPLEIVGYSEIGGVRHYGISDFRDGNFIALGRTRDEVAIALNKSHYHPVMSSEQFIAFLRGAK